MSGGRLTFFFWPNFVLILKEYTEQEQKIIRMVVLNNEKTELIIEDEEIS